MGIVVAATISLISLISSVGSSVYFYSEISALQRYISDVEFQLNADAKFSEEIAENTRILYNNSKVTALRTNLLSTNLIKLKHVNACTVKKFFLRDEQNRLSHDLNDLTTDLVSGKLTP